MTWRTGSPAQWDAAVADPAVRDLLDAFPGTTITAVETKEPTNGNAARYPVAVQIEPEDEPPQTDLDLEPEATPVIEPLPVESAAFHQTDVGNGEYFAARHAGTVLFDHRRTRWLMWGGHRWEPDAQRAVERLAKADMRQRLVDAASLEDGNERARLAKWAISSESRARLDALLWCAQSEAAIADSGKDWDADPHLLACPNGVVDLRTGRRRPGRPEDRITMATAVGYDPKAKAERWTQFIEEIFDGNTELMAFVQRAVGYSLSGVTDEQIVMLLYGTGINGKSTFLNALLNALGDYAYNMPFSTVELKDRASIPNDLAALVNRRFVCASETNDGTRLNEGRLKALSGGDRITARFLHGEFFEFTPTLTLWLSVNHKPVVRDDSLGFWRRIRLIPFTQTFAIDPSLAATFAREAPGILAWAVEGALAWQREGLAAPEIVTAATREYEEESDPLRPFLDEATEVDPDEEVGAADLFNHYTRWARHQGHRDKDTWSRTRFGRKLSERFEARKRGGVKFYQGLRCRGTF